MINDVRKDLERNGHNLIWSSIEFLVLRDCGKLQNECHESHSLDRDLNPRPPGTMECYCSDCNEYCLSYLKTYKTVLHISFCMGVKIDVSHFKINWKLRGFLKIVAEVTFGPNMDEVTGQYRKLHNGNHNLQTLY
jgi:hypothetical protein